MTNISTKYRPTTFKDVVGQDRVVQALKGIIANKSASQFLFSGPSGCGKTTLARIVAQKFGCMPRDVLEIDAATNTGVDGMRLVQDGLRYKPLSRGSSKAIIVDECHMLSKAAWNSLLKVVEEPPAHAFWFFCTTELGKVPATIKTRCADFVLKHVSEKDLAEVVRVAVNGEGVTLKSDIRDLIVREADGSPRQALVNLAKCLNVKSREEAAEILRTAMHSQTVIDLCRFLLNPGPWKKVAPILSALQDENPESVRIVVCNYMAKVLLGSKNEKQIVHVLEVLDSFSTPYNASEKMAPLFLSVGRVVFA